MDACAHLMWLGHYIVMTAEISQRQFAVLNSPRLTSCKNHWKGLESTFPVTTSTEQIQ